MKKLTVSTCALVSGGLCVGGIRLITPDETYLPGLEVDVPPPIIIDPPQWPPIICPDGNEQAGGVWCSP